MKPFFASLFICFSLLNCAPRAFSAPQHSWLVVTTSTGGSRVTLPKEQLWAIRDDSKVSRVLPPPVQSNEYRIFSPDGKRWLKVQHIDGGSTLSQSDELYVGVLGQSTLRKPILDGTLIREAQWTPTNKILVSSGYIDWSTGIEYFFYSLLDPDTGAKLTDYADFRTPPFVDGKSESGYAMSPDESHILLIATTEIIGDLADDFEPDKTGYLVCFNLKEKDAVKTKLIANFSQFGSSFEWSPDSSEFVFSASTGWSRDGNAKPYNLYLYSMKDEQLRQFTFSPFENLWPSWSPDGKRIAWISNRPLKKGDKPDKTRLYIMNADGTHQELFAPDLVNVTSVRWQKDEPK